jgi:SHS2 domain-containing protein
MSKNQSQLESVICDWAAELWATQNIYAQVYSVGQKVKIRVNKDEISLEVKAYKPGFLGIAKRGKHRVARQFSYQEMENVLDSLLRDVQLVKVNQETFNLAA